MNRKTKYFLIGTGLSITLFVAMGIPTALIPNPFTQYVRMIPATLQDYFFLSTTAVLLAALISLKLYFRPEKSKSDCKALAGGAIGFVAFSCPICNALLVATLGSAAILTFIEPLRPILGVASIAVLGYLLYNTAKCRECQPKTTNAKAARHPPKAKAAGFLFD